MDDIVDKIVMGRPTKYDPDLIPGMLDGFAEGMSKLEVCVTILGISVETMNQWEKSNSEFSEAVKQGVTLAEAWWQRQGRTNLKEPIFRDVLWYMNMKNRFGWRDKQEVTGDPEKPLEVNHHVDAMGLDELREAFSKAKGTD